MSLAKSFEEHADRIEKKGCFMIQGRKGWFHIYNKELVKDHVKELRNKAQHYTYHNLSM